MLLLYGIQVTIGYGLFLVSLIKLGCESALKLWGLCFSLEWSNVCRTLNISY